MAGFGLDVPSVRAGGFLMNSNNDLMPPDWKPTEPDEFGAFMNKKKIEYNRTHEGVFNTVHVTNWAHEFVRNLQSRHQFQGGIMAPEQKPTVARIVHYQSYGTPGGEYLSEPRAAVVTEIGENGEVGLAILNPTGMFFTRRVPFADKPTPGCWNWPPRV